MNFLTLANTRPNDPKEWKGRVEFKWRHKPQLRHVKKSDPGHCNSRIGKPEPKTALQVPNYLGATRKRKSQLVDLPGFNQLNLFNHLCPKLRPFLTQLSGVFAAQILLSFRVLGTP